MHQDPFLKLKISDVEIKKPVLVSKDARVSHVARIMLEKNAFCCLVEDEGNIVGIVTERDFLKKVVAENRDPRNVSIEEILTHPIVSVNPDDLLFEAFSLMIAKSIRRLVVLDRSGVPCGIIEDRDMLSAHIENPVDLLSIITKAEDLRPLRNTFPKIANTAIRSAMEGIRAGNIGRLISELNDRIMVRCADLIMEKYGTAVTPFAIGVLGAEGRKEQYLATDQDNLIIYSGNNPDDENFFREFGIRFVEDMCEIGFPPCPNSIMMNNPVWRMSFDKWMREIDKSMSAADADAVLFASLMIDLRCVSGDADLCLKLKEYLYSKLNANVTMLRYLAREAVRFAPPLGLFRNFVPEKSGQGKGRIDIKKGGVFPISLGVKTLAVDNSVFETSTEERINRLVFLNVLTEQMAGKLKDAYETLQSLRLRHQAGCVRQGVRADNYIRPEGLSRAEQDALKESFRIVADFQSFLSNKYVLRLMT